MQTEPTNTSIRFSELAGFQEKQLTAWYQLLEPKCKYLLYGGAASSGKSYFLRWAAIGLGMYYFSKYGVRNVPIGLFSTDYPTLKDRQVIKMKHEIPEFLGTIRESRDEGYAFIGAPSYGSFIVLLRNLDDPSKYKSAEFAAVLVEELTENNEETFDDLRFRMRYKGIDDVKFIGATNPGGLGHGFVKRKWVKPDFDDPDHEQDRFFFVGAKYSDNKYTTPDYVRQLASLPELKRRAYMDGDWDVFAGQYFQEWRDKLHVIPPFIPSKRNVIVGGMDWGRAKPYSFHLSEVSKVQLEDGTKFNRVKTFLEVYGTEKTPREWWDVIKPKLSFYDIKPDDIAWIEGDPAMYTKGQDKSKSIRDQFIDANDTFGRKIKPGSNDRIGGWTNYHTWLRVAPDKIPYYQVTSDCVNLIRTLPELVHDELKVEDVDSDGEDHAPDDQRYMLKKIKHIDASVGRIDHTQPWHQKMKPTAQFVGAKQLSVNIDTWANPTVSSDSSLGGIRHS